MQRKASCQYAPQAKKNAFRTGKNLRAVDSSLLILIEPIAHQVQPKRGVYKGILLSKFVDSYLFYVLQSERRDMLRNDLYYAGAQGVIYS